MAYLLRMWASNTLVVFSIDLAITRIFGVIGELAIFRGLKDRMAFRILLERVGRARMRVEREFRVASISTASLFV